MKKFLILLAVLVLVLAVTEVVSAQPRACSSGGWNRGGLGYGVRSSFWSSNWNWGDRGYYRSSVVYVSPAVTRSAVVIRSAPVAAVPVKTWTEAERLTVVTQRFQLKYRDKLASISHITIQRLAGSEEYHKTGALAEIKYLVTYDLTKKSRRGEEKTTTKDKKFELGFDKFGRLKD